MIGRTLGNYRITEQIGMGGMATVYKAYDPGTDRYVAIKILPEHYSKDSEFYERFRREAKAIARLEHPHILPVHAYGEEDGIAYLVMRFLPTGTLAERIQKGSLSLDEISRLLKQIASALDYAHENGVLHRDVKPSNMLLDDKGNIYLTDFGIARIIESGGDLTGSAMLGTPQYMSPEQCLGQRDLTAATDIYSLGVVLYEMISGQVPFHAETPLAVIHMHMSAPLPPARTMRPDLPESAERVIYKALAKEPESRFATCSEMSKAFDTAIAGLPVDLPAPPTAKSQPTVAMAEAKTTIGAPDAPTTLLRDKPSQRSMTPLLIGAAAVVLIGLVMVVILSGSGGGGTATTPAATESVTEEATQEQVALVPTVTEAPTEAVTEAPAEAATEAAEDASTEETDTATEAPDEEAAPAVVLAEPLAETTLEGVVITTLTFSPNGLVLAVGGADGVIRFWDGQTLEAMGTMASFMDIVASIAYSSDGTMFAAGGVSDVQVWNVGADDVELRGSYEGGVVRAVAFNPASPLLAYGGDAPLVHVVNLDTGEETVLEGLTAGVEGIAFSPGGNLLAAAGGYEDGRIYIWDTSDYSLRQTLETDFDSTFGVAFSPDGTLIATGTAGILVWNVESGEQIGVYPGANYGVTFSPDGRLIVAGADGGAITLLDVQTGEVAAEFQAHSTTARALAFSPDGRFLATGDENGTLRLWDVATLVGEGQ